MEPLSKHLVLKKTHEFPSRGFTLVEMLVVLAIIVVVTAIALFGQTTFNRSLILTDTAYTVAFSIRQAQTLGLSSRSYGGATANAGYGVYFSSANPPGLSSYYLFGDLSTNGVSNSSCPTLPGTPEAKPGNCLYDYNDATAPMDSLVQTFTFSRGFYIDRFCGRELSGSTIRCSNNTNTGYLRRMSLVFLRPNTDTIITGVQSSGTQTPLRNASIRVSAPDGTAFREVCVSSVGQVFVATSTCPL